MKCAALSVWSLAILLSYNAHAQQQTTTAKLSPFTKFFMADRKNGRNGMPEHYVYRKHEKGNLCLAAMIKVNDAVNIAAIEKLGARIGTQAGRIWTVSVPPDQLDRFISLPGIEYIQLDEPLMNTMDAARAVTRADSVQNGIAPLLMPYSGKNVVMGIIDAGFDYNHPTLRDTTGNQWRIKKVWEQKSAGTAPVGFSYGNEISDSSLIKTTGTDYPAFSHGTHVAGIAAGSGFGSKDNRQFRGIAYQSDLVIVGIRPAPEQWIETGMSDIIDGMNYIYSFAATEGKPAVANLSWGCTMGPHDGSSLFSQACDALSGKGKLFVCSGGNNGVNNIHLNKTFTSADTLINTELALPSGVNKTWLDVWGDTAKKFCMKITLYNGATAGSSTGYVCLDNALHSFSLVGSDGDTCFLDLATEDVSFNDKPRMFLRVRQNSKNTIFVSVRANEGVTNMWTGYVENATGYYGAFTSGVIPGSSVGNTNMTTGDIADTKSAIAVASFASKVKFTNLNGDPISYATYASLGGKAPYSSKGPTADGRTKPDIAGPGLMIGSGVSSFDPSYAPAGSNYDHSVAVYNSPLDSKNYYYSMLTGTSMSSPVVAGIVGLMLEANPDLDPAGTISILKATALHDTYTGAATPAGSNLWGHGKVNAFAAVNRAVEKLGISSASGINAADCRLYPNPSNGYFNLDFISNKNETVTVSVCDITGKQLFSKQWKVNAGLNSMVIDGTAFSRGLYFTGLQAPAQGNIVIKTLIK